jgi:hypothetical protein
VLEKSFFKASNSTTFHSIFYSMTMFPW